MKKFNYFQMITDSVLKAQTNIEEPGSVTLVIAHSKETRGKIYVSNCDLQKGKKFPWNQSEMMTEIFKQLILDYGSAITEVELMIPRRNRWDKQKFTPVLFGVSHIEIKPTGEGKFLARSKEHTKQYIAPNPDPEISFPFSYKMVTQVFIDLKYLENIWIIRQEKVK